MSRVLPSGRVVRSGLLLLPLLLGACFPAVTHGPRVDPGWTAGASFTLPVLDPSRPSKAPYLVGPAGLDLGYGFTDTAGGPAVRLGSELDLFPPRFDPDLYLQLPRAPLGGLDAGVGVAASISPATSSWMPYVQVGAIDDGHRGFYLTEGYLWPAGRNSGETVVSEGQAEQTTLAYQWPAGIRVWHVFTTLMFRGPYPPCVHNGEACGGDGRRSWALFAGSTVEFSQR